MFSFLNFFSRTIINENAITARIMHGIHDPLTVEVIFINGNLNVPSIIPIKKAIVADSYFSSK